MGGAAPSPLGREEGAEEEEEEGGLSRLMRSTRGRTGLSTPLGSSVSWTGAGLGPGGSGVSRS